MRDSKSFFLLIVVLIFVTISFTVISIWGYRYYFGSAENTQAVLQPAKSSISEKKESTTDSLEHILDSIIRESKDHRDTVAYNSADSLDRTLELKILQYNNLKSDIIEILNKKAALKNSAIVNEKISLLQQTVDDMRERNNEIVNENERLKETLKQLTALKSRKEQQITSDNNSAQKNVSKSSHSLPLLVSHLRFAAINIEKNRKKITTLALDTDEFEGSFEINIKRTEKNSPKIFIVILQPDRKVLPDRNGKSGMFYTPAGNKKYSASVQFDVKKDNHKRLYFSIAAAPLNQKGKYTMQIYHGGILIGRLNKILL